MAVKTNVLKNGIKDVLENHILKFWKELQGNDGGFYEGLSKYSDKMDCSPGNVILNAKILWALSLTCQYLDDNKSLIAATKLKDYFLEHFQDHKFGGVYYEIGRDGKRTVTETKLKAQAIAISALSRYYLVSKDQESQKMAINLFKVVEKEFYDADRKIYRNVLARDFSKIEGSEEETCLRCRLMLLNGYRNLYRTWKDETLRKQIIILLGKLSKDILEEESPKLKTVYIHVALKAALAIGDFAIVDAVRSVIAEISVEDTVCKEGGVQPYLVIADLYKWKYLNEAAGADRALLNYEKMAEKFKANEAETFLHFGPVSSVRMCIEILSIFE